MGNCKAAEQQMDRIRKWLEKDKLLCRMDWEESLSRGHLSPHFKCKRVSVGRQGGCGTGKGQGTYHDIATVL